MSELGSMALVAMLLVVVDRRIYVCGLLVATLEGLDSHVFLTSTFLCDN
jgi:hypothetical protein